MVATAPRFKFIHTSIPASKDREGTKRELIFIALCFFQKGKFSSEPLFLPPQTLNRLLLSYCQNICSSLNKSLKKENWIVMTRLRQWLSTEADLALQGTFDNICEHFWLIQFQTKTNIGKDKGKNSSWAYTLPTYTPLTSGKKPIFS